MEQRRTTSWDFEEAFELTGHGCYNYLALVTCSVICIAVSLDIFGFSVVVDAATCDMNLTIPQVGLLVGAPFAGVLFAYPWGFFADTRGRRLAILVSTSVGFVFGALASIAVSWEMMFAAKIIGSIFSLSSFTLTITYLAESVTAKKKNEYIFMMSSVNLGAEMVTFGLAYYILPLKVSFYIPWLSITFQSWRLYSLIMSIFLGVSTLMMLCLHESPKFLANKGELHKALYIMEKIYAMNGGERDGFPVKSLKMTNPESSKNVSFCSSLVIQSVPLFQRPLLWRTLQLFYLISVACAICNICLMWFPTMVHLFFESLAPTSAGPTTFCEGISGNFTLNEKLDSCTKEPVSDKTLISGFFTSLFFGLLNLSVSKLAAWRRIVLISAFLVAAVGCVMVTLLRDPIASIIFFAMIQTTGVGIGCVASYYVDMYHTSYRGLAASLGFMVARSVAWVSVVVIGDILVYHCDLIFHTATAMILIGILIALFLPSDKPVKKV